MSMATDNSVSTSRVAIGDALDRAKMSKLHMTFWFLGGLVMGVVIGSLFPWFRGRRKKK